jgi:hypothetical protein
MTVARVPRFIRYARSGQLIRPNEIATQSPGASDEKRDGHSKVTVPLAANVRSVYRGPEEIVRRAAGLPPLHPEWSDR